MKQYIKPEIECVYVLLEAPITLSKVNYDSTESIDPNRPALTSRRRSAWEDYENQ